MWFTSVKDGNAHLLYSALVWLAVMCMLVGIGIAVRELSRTRQLLHMAPCAHETDELEKRQSDREGCIQIWGILFASLTAVINIMWRTVIFSGILPIPQYEADQSFVFLTLAMIPTLLDVVGNLMMVLIFSGVFTGTVTANRSNRAVELERLAKRRSSILQHAPCKDSDWQAKVEELAGRGFTLEALLNFYHGLGQEYMTHFDASKSTTADVVRQAIIPLSQPHGCALATVMMHSVPTRPQKMVTHNWGNLFTDLVAAIVADSLGDAEFDLLAFMLDHHFEKLVDKITHRG